MRSPCAAHDLPPYLGLTASVRTCVRLPQPHVTLQALHGDWYHGCGTQSIGQCCVLHLTSSSFGPHALPLLTAGTWFARQRILVPVPHDAEHCVNVLHCVITQSTSHAWRLQGRVSFVIIRPQALPAPRACALMDLKRVFMPPPQVFVHPVIGAH